MKTTSQKPTDFAEAMEIINNLVLSGCERRDRDGDMECFHCGVDLWLEKDHEPDCDYIRAQAFLARFEDRSLIHR